jgi:hypothetical protein
VYSGHSRTAKRNLVLYLALSNTNSELREMSTNMLTFVVDPEVVLLCTCCVDLMCVSRRRSVGGCMVRILATSSAYKT